MLGGFSALHEPDIADSQKFLDKHWPRLKAEHHDQVLG